MQICAQCAEPLLSFGRIGGFEGLDTEGVDVADLVDIDCAVYVRACPGVRADDVGYLQPGGVESLGGGEADDRRGVHRAVWHILSARGSELAVNLVAHHRDAVMAAYLCHPLQLEARPESPGGICRIAEQQHAGLGARAKLLETVEIHAVCELAPAALLADKWIVEPQASVVAYRREEAVIDRGLHDDPLARRYERLDYGRDGRDNPRGIDYVGGVNDISVAASEPRHQRIIILLVDERVAEYSVLHAAPQRLDDAGCGLEIHVGYPQGEGFGTGVPLVRPGAAARWGGVEIKM